MMYILEKYNKFDTKRGLVIYTNRKDEKCEDIKVGDIIKIDDGEFEVLELEKYQRVFGISVSDNIGILYK